MTDYNIKNTDINEENNFREWERLVMDYEPVRRNLYEIYCKSLEKKQTNLFTGGDFNTEPIYTEPIIEPEPIVEPKPKPIVEPTFTINTSFLNRQLQELENDDDNFSSEEEEEEVVVEEVVEEVKEEVKEEFRPDPTINLGLQFFRLEIPKMNVDIRLYHKNTANKHVSFTTDSCEFYKQIVIQKSKEFWINIIDENHKFNPHVKPIQLNKTQKEILLTAYPYDKKRLPTMFITHIKD